MSFQSWLDAADKLEAKADKEELAELKEALKQYRRYLQRRHDGLRRERDRQGIEWFNALSTRGQEVMRLIIAFDGLFPNLEE